MTPERKKIVRILVLVAVFDLLLTAVGFFLWTRYYRQPGLPNEQEQAQLGARLVNLSAAAEGYFSTLPAAPDSSEAEILRKATEHDSSLLDKLNGYRLRIAYAQKHALLLLCTKDGKQALLEDAGCTASLDRRVREAAPCEFTLKADEVCR
ncbi:hypothetical protein [Candidatus Electronema sp. JM]|uniref:hypothetical protein n=1 Tax=Candidatus Electronema sp. JM TaxID=3401571 RepID=UPI003AA8DD84